MGSSFATVSWRHRARRLLGPLGVTAATCVHAVDRLPPEVDAALQRARIPTEAVAVVVQQLPGGRR
jgi:serine-type D-Ala-D-Ala carboxypeptidase/endopeptidase (penicillin-binding protein 4)